MFVRYTQPEPVVIRILKPKEGKEIWETMTGFHERKKRSVQVPILRDNPANRMIG